MKLKWNGAGNIKVGSEIHGPGSVVELADSVYADLDETVKAKLSRVGNVAPVAAEPAEKPAEEKPPKRKYTRRKG